MNHQPYTMSDELKNILNNSNKDIDNQKLMDYISHQLSKQESHDMEKAMADDDFMNDAIEGLQQFNNVKNVPLSVEQLNKDLQKKLAKKKLRKEKRKLKEEPWLYFTIILLLILIVICYMIVKKHNAGKTVQPKPNVSQAIIFTSPTKSIYDKLK